MIDFFYQNSYYEVLKNGNFNIKINYLDPSDNALIAVIGWHEENDGHLDAGVYKSFIRNKKYWDKIYDIKPWHIINFIEPFFIKWGYMYNLYRFKKDWKDDLLQILSGETGKILMEFDNLHLLTISEKELLDN